MGTKERRRIKQVRVQEKIIHKNRLQYFIGRGEGGGVEGGGLKSVIALRCDRIIPSYLLLAGQNCALNIQSDFLSQ